MYAVQLQSSKMNSANLDPGEATAGVWINYTDTREWLSYCEDGDQLKGCRYCRPKSVSMTTANRTNIYKFPSFLDLTMYFLDKIF